MRQLFEQQQRVHEHIAFGMKLWRLFYPLHSFDLGQHFAEQPSFVE